MTLEQLLTNDPILKAIYDGLTVKTEMENNLDEFNAGYFAGYRGAILATFDGLLDMLGDLPEGSEK